MSTVASSIIGKEKYFKSEALNFVKNMQFSESFWSIPLRCFFGNLKPLFNEDKHNSREIDCHLGTIITSQH